MPAYAAHAFVTELTIRGLVKHGDAGGFSGLTMDGRVWWLSPKAEGAKTEASQHAPR